MCILRAGLDIGANRITTISIIAKIKTNMNNKNKRKNRRLKITKARKTLALILMASKLKIRNKLNKLKQ